MLWWFPKFSRVAWLRTLMCHWQSSTAKTEMLKRLIRILPEIEGAPHYKLLKLFTLFTPFTLFTLFTLLTLLKLLTLLTLLQLLPPLKMLSLLKQRLSKNTVMPLIVDCHTQLLSVLGFSFVFHDKAKRTQQGNLLSCCIGFGHRSKMLVGRSGVEWAIPLWL